MCVLFAGLIAFGAVAEKQSVRSLGLSVPFDFYAATGHLDEVSPALDATLVTHEGINVEYQKMSLHGTGVVGYSGIFGVQAGIVFSQLTGVIDVLGWHYDESEWSVTVDGEQPFSSVCFDLLNIKWGPGVGFRPSEKIILATHLTLGADFGFNADGFYLSPRVGGDFVFSCKIKERLGIIAGLEGYLSPISLITETIPATVIRKSQSGVYDDHVSETLTAFGSGFAWKFGVCWVF